MTLSLYIARRFVWLLLGIILGFATILLLIDSLDQLRRLSGQGISLGQATLLAAMNMPSSLYRILPLLMILAAITLFMGLARSSELVVVRASGRSGLRFLATPVLAALLFGAVAVAVLNPLVAATLKRYDTLLSKYAQDGESVLSINDDGLWLRQGGPDGQTVIHAARANADGTELFSVTFLSFDAAGLPSARTEAREARLGDGAWALVDAKTWPLNLANPEASAARETGTRLPSDLTRDAIRDSFGTPAAISIWNLPSYIAGLERAGFSARSHRVWLQTELALPLLLAAMVLIAAGFTMRPTRSGKTGTYVLLALLGGFGIFFLRNFAQVLGENGQIPIAMAAWSPPAAAVLFAVGLLLHLEDG
ncbi:LPS export ABC transporter permease LptG [Rhodobacter ferrooxidans]|uniref:Permease YjgP/YjgQ family protein n=1 Tax=Rhodobacter ferrooxidans TaxID=371731 RepID=C8S3V6_9RHOB|nr:LPS export ABC transporter permease LptG [Rhodobacter sp. SW2]EEW24325.1 permease YjgP/YjgQ family protein [Rhodobacter sp. SW2]